MRAAPARKSRRPSRPKAVGAAVDDIVKVVFMLKNPADYKKMNAVRAEYFRKQPPISTCFRAKVMRHMFGWPLCCAPMRRAPKWPPAK
jgi:endoribonuclease L-PSP